MNEPRPTSDKTADGRTIVYPIWREDLAEAVILASVPTTKPKANSATNATKSSGIR